MESEHGMPPPSNNGKQVNIKRTIVTLKKASNMITVPTYRMKTNTLWVFVNGIKLYHEYDYNEIDTTTIEFIDDVLPAGAVVECLVIG